MTNQRLFRWTANQGATRLLPIITAALLLTANVYPQQQRTASGPYNHSGNLLYDPDASSSINSWTLNGNWTVASGPVTIGSSTLNSSDGSPWFVNSGSILVNNSCNNCAGQQMPSLTQTIDFAPYGGILKTYQSYTAYGGDAFAAGIKNGTGVAGYQSSVGYQAVYRVDFIDSNGNTIASDFSPPLLSPSFGCVLPVQKQQQYGYRRTITGIPANTRWVKFTATITDKVSACMNSSTTGNFQNGFDNLWFELVYNGRMVIARFKKGPPPGPAVKLKQNPK